MNPHPSGIAAALSRVWSALVRAFTPTRARNEPNADGAETTLFGPLPERSRAHRTQHGEKDQYWDAGGESTDFADPDPDKERQRR